MITRVASQGYVRNRLTVLQGGAKRGASARGGDRGTDRGDAPSEPALPLFEGALAFAATVEAHAPAPDARLAQIREARLKGYEGDSCQECGNFTLVRNGTCLKCDTCGSTSGCS